MTTFTAAPKDAVVEKFGTYALASDCFEDGMNAGDITTFKSFTVGTENVKAPSIDGQAFIVDVVNIPIASKYTTINAISFVKIKGIETPIYYYYTNPICVGDNAKNLGEKA